MPMLDRYMKHRTAREIDLQLYRLSGTASLAEIKSLIEAGADPKVAALDEMDHWFYPIHRAALNPDLEVLKYFVSLGEDPCRMDFWAREPLSFAVRQNPLSHVEYLVSNGNHPDNEDCDGGTVIAEAALNPHVEVLDFLLAHDADLDAGAMFEQPLPIAVSRGTPDRVRYFIEHGATVSFVDAIVACHAPIANLQVLLECGYDANQKDDFGPDRVIDHLDPERRALFERFGGRVLNPNAEKYYLTM